jgi:Zn-dependent protease with chaperone function
MRRVVLKAILRLGRYAVLPVVAVAFAMVMVWLIAIDRYTILALAAAPIVLCAAPAAIALGLGLLLLPSRRDRNPKVDEAAAPGLWVIWKELDRAFVRSGRTLLINADFNASIREERRYAGLFKQQITMTVGLPLLIVLDQRAIAAVIAHEVAHARLQHTSGGTNLFEFITASENVLYYADPDRTITGRVAHALLHSLLEWLQEEYRALSRENELCADEDGASQVGRDEMARALVLMEGGSARLTDLVFAPLEKELTGAIKAPTPPLQRIFNQLGDIRAPEQLAAAAVVGLRQEEDPKSTHPPLGKRLANLGFTDIPPIDGVQTSAIDQVLSRHAVRELVARFDGEWRKTVDGFVHVGSR